MRKTRPVKSRQAIIKAIGAHKFELKEKFKVAEIGVFGSFVRGEQKCRSDIDVLVEFLEGGVTFRNYMDLKFYLEELLDKKVDLVIKRSIRKELKDIILSEAVYV